MEKRFKSLAEFYLFYLKEHSRASNRVLHVIGTGSALVLVVVLIAQQQYAWLPIALIPGYAFAWIGHFFIEKNRPATFRYPLYSLMCDFIMFYDLLSGARAFNAFDQK